MAKEATAAKTGAETTPVEDPQKTGLAAVADAEGNVDAGKLLKAIQGFEAASKGTKIEPEPEPDPKVPTTEVDPLAKTIKGAEGSEELAKSLDVSESLREFADLVGVHVDTLTKAFGKTVDVQNASILGLFGVLEGMQKSIDGLTDQVKIFGEQPGKPAGVKTDGKVETLVKKIGDAEAKGDEGDPEAPVIGKPEVLEGLEHLVKSCTKDGDTDGADRFQKALIKFDSTTEIGEADLKRAVKAYKTIAADE